VLLTMSYSVVIPTTGRAKLKRAIASCLEQTLKPNEILVVHNGVNDLAAQFSFPSLVRFVSADSPASVRSPASRNRNLGVTECSYDLVAFLDDDDVWLPRKMERQISFLVENGLDFLASSSICKKEVSTFKSVRPKKFYSSEQGSVFEHFYGSPSFFGNDAYMPTPSFLVRREVALAEPFNENFPYFEDIDWLQRLYLAGYSMGQLADVLVEISVNPFRSSNRQEFDFNKTWILRISEESPILAANFVRAIAIRSALMNLDISDLMRYLFLLKTLVQLG